MGFRLQKWNFLSNILSILSLDDRDAVMVRFNGGAQAVHTVVTNHSQRYVFRDVSSRSFVSASLSKSIFCFKSYFILGRNRHA